MKIKHILAALAVTSLSANAAAILTNGSVTSTNGGDYGGFSAQINDADFAITGSLEASMNLDFVSVFSRAGASGNEINADTFMNVYDGATFIASSDNAFNWSTAMTTEGAEAKYAFTGVTLDTTKLYTFRYSSTNADGDLDHQARTQVVRDEVLDGSQLSAAGAAADTSWDAKSTIELSTVPEPSSTALLGLGGLALILRRRK